MLGFAGYTGSQSLVFLSYAPFNLLLGEYWSALLFQLIASNANIPLEFSNYHPESSLCVSLCTHTHESGLLCLKHGGRVR
jgi:hypothetical protein